MTLGIALLGTGGIAQHAFVPAVHAVDEAHLVAVLSPWSCHCPAAWHSGGL